MNALHSLLALALVLSLQPARADDAIFVSAAQPQPITTAVSLETVMSSPTMTQNREQVFAAAGARIDQLEHDGVLSATETQQIKGWFRGLPFRRIVDVQLTFFSGIPDTIGLCLQANPTWYLSVDACAATIAIISSISAHVTSRFLHYVNIKGKTNSDGSTSYWGDEFSVGPSLGYRFIEILGFDSSGGTAMGIDTFLSAEWVHWFSRYFGMGLKLDGGATFTFDKQPESAGLIPILPNAKLSLGLSF